mmetsp:Transcript_27746/g.70306  ORF Transcript_27746/g.70306 Transcript_27746/m.70306 type:complete len:364 (+) Transcript_27746:42-1133(+)
MFFDVPNNPSTPGLEHHTCTPHSAERSTRTHHTAVTTPLSIYHQTTPLSLPPHTHGSVSHSRVEYICTRATDTRRAVHSSRPLAPRASPNTSTVAHSGTSQCMPRRHAAAREPLSRTDGLERAQALIGLLLAPVLDDARELLPWQRDRDHRLVLLGVPLRDAPELGYVLVDRGAHGLALGQLHLVGVGDVLSDLAGQLLGRLLELLALLGHLVLGRLDLLQRVGGRLVHGLAPLVVLGQLALKRVGEVAERRPNGELELRHRALQLLVGLLLRGRLLLGQLLHHCLKGSVIRRVVRRVRVHPIIAGGSSGSGTPGLHLGLGALGRRALGLGPRGRRADGGRAVVAVAVAQEVVGSHFSGGCCG